MIISLGPKNSRTKFLKKRYLSSDKRIWHIFSRFIECDKAQGTICNGPTGVLTVTVEVIKSFPWHLRGCLKTQIFEKKANFPVKKRFWLIFSLNFECDKPPGTICKGSKVILTVTVELIGDFFSDPRGCWKHKFLKKSNIFSQKTLWRNFLRSIEHDKCEETTYKGTQGILTSIVPAIWSFL